MSGLRGSAGIGAQQRMALEEGAEDRRAAVFGAVGTKSRRRQAMISEVRPSAFNCGTAPSE